MLNFISCLTPAVTQESIEHFAYEVFIGSLSKGKLWTEPNYKSKAEIAFEDLIARRKLSKLKLEEKMRDLITKRVAAMTSGFGV